MFYKYIKIFILSFLIYFCATNPLLAFDKRAVKIYNEGMDLNYLEKYDEAINCFKEALEIDPTFLEAYNALAASYENIGSDNEALKTYEILFSKTSNDYDLAYKIGLMYSEIFNKEKTAYYLKKIPPENKNYGDARDLARCLGINIDINPNIKPKISNFENNKLPKDNSGKSLVKKFAGPAGIAKDNEGNIYVADFSDNSIIQINTHGEKRVLFKGSPLDRPLGLAIDIFNNIYVANYNSNEILKISLENNTIKVLFKNVSKPYYLMVDSLGYLYVTEQGTNALSKFKVF